MRPTARSMELRRQRQGLINDARGILDGAEAANRDLDAQERERYDRLDADIETLTERIEREERQAERDAAADERLGGGPIDPPAGGPPGGGQTEEARQRRFAALRAYLLRGQAGLTDTERRDLQADADTAGGFTIPDMQFINELLQAVTDQTFMRQPGWSTVLPLTGAVSLGVPYLSARMSSFQWGTELQVATKDATMAFGRRELIPHDATSYIVTSRKLLERSPLPIDQLIRQDMSRVVAEGQESAFMTGSGNLQPLGLFTASNDGISTGRDVSTGNAATEIGADGLIEALFSLKAQYQARARWLFSRTAVKQIRKLKDGDGQYLWSAGIAGGQPATILDKPYAMSEFCPATFTSGQYVGIVGDFSKYWIAEAMTLSIQQLNELLALSNQVGYIGRLAVDGMPVLEEAFARVKLG